MKDLEKEQEAPSLHNDSQSAINLANNLVYHDRITHIDVRYHFIRKLLKDGVFSLLKTDTNQNLADTLTKMVTVEKLKIYSAFVGLQACESEFESLGVTVSREREKNVRDRMLQLRHYQSPSGRLLKLWGLIVDLDGKLPSEKYYTRRTARPSRSGS